MHRLTDHVLARHRADGCLPVTTSRKRRATRALQVQVVTASVDAQHLAEQERPAIAEAWREPTELMACVGLRHRRRAYGVVLPTRTATPSVALSASTSTPSSVANSSLSEQPGRRCRCHLRWLVQAPQVTNIGVVEREQRPATDAHRPEANVGGWLPPWRRQWRLTPPYFMRVSLIEAARASPSLMAASTTSPTNRVCVPRSSW